MKKSRGSDGKPPDQGPKIAVAVLGGVATFGITAHQLVSSSTGDPAHEGTIRLAIVIVAGTLALATVVVGVYLWSRQR